MKPKFTIEDLAMHMYNCTDHSDIRDDLSGYTYTVTASSDGTLGEASLEEHETFYYDSIFSPDFWNGIDQDAFQWDDEYHEEVIYELLDRADDQEDLSNPYFTAAVEDMYGQISRWLSRFED